MRAGRLLRLALATAAFSCLTAVSAPSALADVAWRDADPGDAIPKEVDLADAASSADENRIVAVGTDTTSGDATSGDALIYHRTAGGWVKDSIDGAPKGALTDVAVTNGAGIAVGGKPGANGDDPLILRLDPVTGGWVAITAPAGLTGAVRSVALRDTTGYIGDGQGHIYPINTNAPGTVGSAIQGAGSEKPVNGIALFTDGGFAVEDRATTVSAPGADPVPSPAPPIFKFVQGSGFGPDTAEQDSKPDRIIAVATLGAGSATAIDEIAGPKAYWEPDATGVWRHRSLADASKLTDVSMAAPAAPGGNVVTAISGANASNQPIVWRRAGTDPWAKDLAPAPSTAPLNGVAALKTDDIYAVGDKGTVLRYWDKPAENTGGTGGTGGDGGTGGTGDGTSGCSCSYFSTTSTKQVDQSPDVIVVQPKPPTKPGGQPRRLMSDVAVRRGKRKLIIGFRLRKRARVGITVRRKKHVLAHMRLKTFKAGRHRVVLHYRSKRPPTRLKIVVKNAGK